MVDPVECRILDFQEDGRVSMNERCYGIWNAEQKCINCSSALACRTGCHQEKAERFQDQDYFIQSNPVKLRLSDGSLYDAVVELVNVGQTSATAANDREAENVGTRASHYMAHHDSLTNVLNADAFYELSREMLKKQPDISWVMITGNIMNFRLINTLFGVLKGNEALVRTAALLRNISDRPQGLCGRLGGDQFALLLPRDGVPGGGAAGHRPQAGRGLQQRHVHLLHPLRRLPGGRRRDPRVRHVRAGKLRAAHHPRGPVPHRSPTSTTDCCRRSCWSRRSSAALTKP